MLSDIRPRLIHLEAEFILNLLEQHYAEAKDKLKRWEYTKQQLDDIITGWLRLFVPCLELLLR